MVRWFGRGPKKPKAPESRPLGGDKVGAKAELRVVEDPFKRTEHDLEEFRKNRQVDKSGTIVWDLGKVNVTNARFAIWALEGIKKVKKILAIAELNKIIPELQSLSKAWDAAGNTARKVETDEVIVEACAIAEDDVRINAIKEEYRKRRQAAERAGKKTEAKYWQDMATKLVNKADAVRGGWTMFKERIGPGKPRPY